ncbi:MAG: hypothetical protein A2X12_09535 [Bacteroidetes bacterium GWE2_29_8]|nr:MAG: hypothetical protein A2X12_09535 [Bacteroidetes bacterium GWE2_29_8]OFY17749.1 MAG: hypothetical protein A2X02_03685 [Bacteroidetes bacterium GWF2_29_10]
MASKTGKIRALLNLLDDPDTKIYDSIKKELESYGIEIVSILENEWEINPIQFVQKRIENIIHNIQLNELKKQLTNWVTTGNQNLLNGYILFSKYYYPEINELEIRSKVEQLKDDIWKELNDSLTPLQKVKILNHFFYDIHKFNSNSINLHLTQNLFINNLLDNKRGNTWSLGILYNIIAENLNIPIKGISLPMQYILAYLNYNQEVPIVEKKTVLFYINPLHKGSVFTKKEIIEFLIKAKLQEKNEYFEPSSNISTIKTLFEYLKNSLNEINNESEEEENDTSIYNNISKNIELEKKIEEIDALINILDQYN